MIVPIVPLPKDGRAPADMLTSRLAAISEVMLLGSGDDVAGSGAELAAGYKAFLSECGCRVGPFDVLSGDQDAKVSKPSKRWWWQWCGGDARADAGGR